MPYSPGLSVKLSVILEASVSSAHRMMMTTDDAASSTIGPRDDVPVQSSRKRQFTTDTRSVYSRKRAVTACQHCRVRKSKCDNQRPSCGSCINIGATCSFQDQQADYSKFDPASLAILDRINYAVQILETQATNRQHAPSYHNFLNSPATQHVGGEEERAPVGHEQIGHLSIASIGDGFSPTDLLTDTNNTLSDALSIDSKSSSSSFLEWPIFHGLIVPQQINSALFNPLSPANAEILENVSKHNAWNLHSVFRKPSRGVREDDCVALVEAFLRNVHTKNPILDPSDLLDMARNVTEEGFKWDAVTCLVLIACALGSLSTPWAMTTPHASDSSLADSTNYSQAESYYTAARKRSGLLNTSVLDTQCVFLIGVYEMYSLRPLRAWLSFHRACTIFQLHLHTRSLNNSVPYSRLEQRLYWSCLKSECEMREEVDLPPTGLAKVEYPDIFPSPPGSTPEPESGQANDRATWEPVLQRSWYYYLSEIASRRIANRIITSLYGVSPEKWLSTPAKRLHRIAKELDAQLLQWWEHIPGSPTTSVQSDTDELTFMLQIRYMDLRQRVWRPFLYIAVHKMSFESDKDLIIENASTCLNGMFDYININSIKHRHHGCWYAARVQFAMALGILAAVKSGQLEVRSDWRQYLQRVQTFLQYWEAEAQDLVFARLALADLVAAIDNDRSMQDVS